VTVTAAPPRARAVVPATPYVGLTPFTESDAPFFFGREKERRIISANLLASRLTLLYGASGVGKSSIIRAGVQRDFRVRAEKALAAGLFPESIVVVSTGWRDDPITGLADCVAAAVKELLGELAPEPPRARLALDDLLVEWNRLLDEKAVEHAGATADVDEPIRTELLVIFDQFEQYFVYHGDEDGPDTFAVQFPQAVNRENLRGSFLISLREDAYTQLDRFEGRILNLFAGNLRIEHLDERAATDAIVKPVEKYNELLRNGGPPYRVEPGLVKAVITQVRAGSIVLGQAGGGIVEHEKDAEPEQSRVETPFLQLVMSRLWAEEQRRNSHVLREETLKNLGGAEKIVRRHLDEAMSALGPDERAVAARMFHQLVTPSGARIVHKADDLARYAGVTFEVAEPILERLDERRILRTIDPAPGEATPRFEIRHDVLAGAVVEWCRQYEDRKRREEEELKQREELEKQRRRLRMRALVGLAVALAFLIPAVIGGIYVWNARSDARAQRDSARSVARAADAEALLGAPDPIDSVRAGYAAFTTRHAAPAAEEVFRSALIASHRRAVLRGHKNSVVAARFSPDGKTVATASSDGSARLWSTATGRSLHRLPAKPTGAFDAAITDVAFSPDGSMVATASTDGRARLFDVASGRLRATFVGGRKALNSIVFSRDGRLVLAASDNGTAKIWRTDGSAHPLFRALGGHTDAVYTASFSPNGRLVVTASADGTSRVWDLLHHGQPPLVLRAEKRKRMETASFSPDGRTVVTAGDDGKGRVWDARSGRLLATLVGRGGPILHAEFSPDGKLIVTAGTDGTAQLWRANGQSAGILNTETGAVVRAASFSPDSAFVVTATQGGDVRVWRAATHDLVAQLRGHDESNSVNAASFSPDGRLVVTASSDATARLWDPGTGGRTTVLATGRGSVADLAFEPDPKLERVVVTGPDGGLQVWNIVGARRSQALLRDAGRVTSVAVSPNGRLIAATSVDGTTRVLDTKDFRTSVVLPNKRRANDAAFSPNGKLLLVAYDEGSRLWRLRDREPTPLTKGSHVTHVAFSPDGKLLLTVAGRSAVIRDLDGKQVMFPLHYAAEDTRIVDAAFGPADGLVVTGASNGSAAIWDAEGQKLREMHPSRKPITSVSFGDDGKFVVTTSEDGQARIWETGSGRLLTSVDEGASSGLTDAVLSADGRYLVTSGRFGVRVHRCDECLPIAQLIALGHWSDSELGKKAKAG
jgi:WD40 repeat protein